MAKILRRNISQARIAQCLETFEQLENCIPEACIGDFSGHPAFEAERPLWKMGTAPYFPVENRELSLIFHAAKL
jgi:hypothetical protein